MKRYNVYHSSEYVGYVIAKDMTAAKTEAIKKYGCHPDLSLILHGKSKHE